MKMKKLLAIVLALMLVFTVSIPAFAADSVIEVGTADEFTNAVESLTADATIKLTADITDVDVWVNPDTTVTVDGNGFKLINVAFTGDGADSVVIINGDAVTLELSYVTATVNGNVTGVNGDISNADMSDPEGYDDGDFALTVLYTDVTVNGNVTGGKSYGTYGYGGYGILANGNNVDITVNGNVTGGDVEADPAVESVEDCESRGGTAIAVSQGDATVTVNGNVTGGSTNGHNGMGGAAIALSSADGATVTINGTAASGSGANKDSAPIQYDTFVPTPLDLGEFVIPTVDDFETELEADSYYSSQAFSDIETICEANNVDYYGHVNFYSSYMVNVIAELFGEDYFDNINSPEGYEAAFNALTQEQRDKYFEEYYNCLSYVLTGEGDIKRDTPTIAVSKIIDTNGTGIVIVENFNGVETVYDTEMAEKIESAIRYTVKVVASENGTVEVFSDDVKIDGYANGEITIKATANDGYKVSRVLVNGKEITAQNGVYGYVMSNEGIEVSAEFEKIPAEEKPATPTTPTTPDNTDNSEKSPATGDNVAVAVVVLTALAGAAFVSARKAKNNA